MATSQIQPALPSERVPVVMSSQPPNATNMSAGFNVLNLSDQNLRKIVLPDDVAQRQVKKLLLDRNQIIKVENLEPVAASLEQLSIASNRLVRLVGFASLNNLKVLNLPHNSIAVIEGLAQLKNLLWLNLSNNNIKSLDGISQNSNLTYLDVSHNNLTVLSSDLKSLIHLKTLMIQGNLISTLTQFPQWLPMSVTSLSLAENEVSDLCQFSYLSCLPKLEQLAVQKNPSVEFCQSKLDYRPYILNWCLNLNILDSSPVTHRESLKAEWLYTQGKGRKFRPGEMNTLIEYLKIHCPLASSDSDSAMDSVSQSNEDVRLSKVLNKQLQYQKQMQSRRTLLNGDQGSGDANSHRRPANDSQVASGSRNDAGDTLDETDDLSSLNLGSLAPFTRSNVRNDDSLKRRDDTLAQFSPTPQSEHQRVAPEAVLAVRSKETRSQSNLSRQSTGDPRMSSRTDSSATTSFTIPDSSAKKPVGPPLILASRVDADDEDENAQLVSSSFLLPASSPPIARSSESQNGPEVLNGISNLDDVSFSEMLPGLDILPSTNQRDSKEGLISNRPSSSNFKSMPIKQKLSPSLKPSHGESSLMIFNEAAVVIQSFWKSYLCRKRLKSEIRMIKRVARMQVHVNWLTAQVESTAKFQSSMIDVMGQLIAKIAENAKNLESNSVGREEERDTSYSNNVNHRDPKDTLTELRNEFSRMSSQFGGGSNVDNELSGANDTSSSSLRVMSLTEDDASHHWGLEDATEANENQNDDTFTESDADVVAIPSMTSPTSVNPPTNVKVKIRDGNALLISWKPSEVLTPSDHFGSNHPVVSILSYKIVVNGVPRGVVSASKNNAVIEGLDVKNQQFTVTIRAVTALGESIDSFPPVKTCFSSQEKVTKHTLLAVSVSNANINRVDSSLVVTEPKFETDDPGIECIKAPSFSELLRDVQVSENESALFSVSTCKHAKNCNVSWFLGNRALEEDSRVSFSNYGDYFELRIEDCKVSDSNTVMCTIENDAGKVSSLCNLEVTPVEKTTEDSPNEDAGTSDVKGETFVEKTILATSSPNASPKSAPRAKNHTNQYSVTTDILPGNPPKPEMPNNIGISSSYGQFSSDEDEIVKDFSQDLRDSQPFKAAQSRCNETFSFSERWLLESVGSSKSLEKKPGLKMSSDRKRMFSIMPPPPNKSKSPPSRKSTSSKAFFIAAQSSPATSVSEPCAQDGCIYAGFAPIGRADDLADLTQSISISGSNNTTNSNGSTAVSSINSITAATNENDSKSEAALSSSCIGQKLEHSLHLNLSGKGKEETTLVSIENLNKQSIVKSVSCTPDEKSVKVLRSALVTKSMGVESTNRENDESNSASNANEQTARPLSAMGSCDLKFDGKREPFKYRDRVRQKRTSYLSKLIRDSPY